MGIASAGALLAEVPPPAGEIGSADGVGAFAIVVDLAVAAAALYLPGLALALLLTAPRRGLGELRVAVAPLLSVVVASVGVRALGVASVGLHALQLLGLTALLWAAVWWRHRARTSVSAGSTRSAGSAESADTGADRTTPPSATASVPWLVVQLALGAMLWLASLAQVGLALPNRDFKNHAVYVAQLAATGSLDPSVVLRDSPVATTSQGEFYPLGLHALLAWALPVRTGSTVGLTAAAAVVVTVISLPLAVRTLARMWCPHDARLPALAGMVAVCLPGATAGAFAIGSVVLLAGVALYAAGLCVLWLWMREPTPGSTVLLALAVAGLFWLHVAEAVGLLLVGCGLLLLAEGRRVLHAPRAARWVAGSVAVGVCLAALLLRQDLARLLRLRDLDWDLQPNDANLLHAFLGALVQQPVPLSGLCGLWWALAIVGLIRGRRRGWSALPALALTIPLVLGVLTTLQAPALLTAVTAPWYGTAARVMLLAFPVLVVVACTAVLGALEGAGSRPVRAAVAGVAAVLVVVSTASLVPDRRLDLAASLAGAGDSPELARWLDDQLRDGGTVLNLEADGTALLFAYARVPVLSSAGQALVDQPVGSAPLSQRLLDLGDPEVAARLAALDVHFVVLGTASRYWSQGIGYDWQAVAAQSEVELVAHGDQMVVLRYRGDAG